MIQITTNAGQVAGKLQQMSVKVSQVSDKVIHEVARAGESYARNLAPVKTGALKANITTTFNKNRATIMSRVLKDFPYHLWVNVQPGYEKIFLPLAGRKMAYTETKKTGEPAYFTKTAEFVMKMFYEELVKRMDSEL